KSGATEEAPPGGSLDEARRALQDAGAAVAELNEKKRSLSAAGAAREAHEAEGDSLTRKAANAKETEAAARRAVADAERALNAIDLRALDAAREESDAKRATLETKAGEASAGAEVARAALSEHETTLAIIRSRLDTLRGLAGAAGAASCRPFSGEVPPELVSPNAEAPTHAVYTEPTPSPSP